MRLNTASPLTKATLWAIALTTLPIIGLGSWIYLTVDRSLSDQVTQSEATRTLNLSDRVSRFMDERLRDLQELAQQPTFADRYWRDTLTQQEKENWLTQFVKASGLYDSVSLLDPSGQAIAQSTGSRLDKPLDPNSLQQALSSRSPIVGSPQQLPGTNTWVLPITTPILDSTSHEPIALVQASLPLTTLTALFNNSTHPSEQIYLADSQGTVFLTSTLDRPPAPDTKLTALFPNLDAQIRTQQAGTVSSNRNGQSVLLSYNPLPQQGTLNLHWSTVTTIEPAIALAPKQSLLNTIATGIGISAIGVGILAAWWVRRRNPSETFNPADFLGFALADLQQHQSALRSQLAEVLKDINTIQQTSIAQPTASGATGTAEAASPTAAIFAAGSEAITHATETIQDVNDLVQALAQATTAQSETSKLIATVITDIAQAASPETVKAISDTVHQTVELVQDLTSQPHSSPDRATP